MLGKKLKLNKHMNRKFKFLVVIALLKERSNLVVGQVGYL